MARSNFTPSSEFLWDFAISYSSEESGVAADLANLLRKRGVKVFFALSSKAYLWGKNLSSELAGIFGPRTRFVVPILSRSYVEKHWPFYEFAVASAEQERRRFEFVLPVKIDNVQIPGLDPNILYLDLRKEGVLRTVEIMLEKLGQVLARETEQKLPQLWVATFGVLIRDLIESGMLPPDAPEDYPSLCDWLEQDLLGRLGAVLRGVTLPEASHRDGEALSVRVSFDWDPTTETLNLGDLGWWEVLEVEPYDVIYPPAEEASPL